MQSSTLNLDEPRPPQYIRAQARTHRNDRERTDGSTGSWTFGDKPRRPKHETLYNPIHYNIPIVFCISQIHYNPAVYGGGGGWIRSAARDSAEGYVIIPRETPWTVRKPEITTRT